MSGLFFFFTTYEQEATAEPFLPWATDKNATTANKAKAKGAAHAANLADQRVFKEGEDDDASFFKFVRPVNHEEERIKAQAGEAAHPVSHELQNVVLTSELAATFRALGINVAPHASAFDK